MITAKTIKYIIISLLVICFINFIVFIISFDKSDNNQIKENKEEIILDDVSDNIQIANSADYYRTKEMYASVAQAEELRLIRFELQSLNSNLVVLLNKK